MAEYGRAFGMRVIAWSQNLSDDAVAVGARRVEKDDLSRLALSLVCYGENGRGGPGPPRCRFYQRLRPRSPPPPPRLPPLKLDSRGLASFTLMFLPLSSESLNCAIALDASSELAISTKPKPFDWPENLSMMTVALCT